MPIVLVIRIKRLIGGEGFCFDDDCAEAFAVLDVVFFFGRRSSFATATWTTRGRQQPPDVKLRKLGRAKPVGASGMRGPTAATRAC
jgi:hypothetical protein